MKTTMLYSLLFLTMLGLGIGCKKEVEPVKPPVVKPTPPTSTTTPTSTTQPAPVFLTPPPNCVIAKTVYKSVNLQGPVREQEIVKIDGKTFTVSIQKETYYYYDQQGRLITEIFGTTLGDSGRVQYDYQPGRILVDKRYTGSGNQLVTRRDTILLDNRGLAIRREDYQEQGEYDAEGYLIKLTSRIKKETITIENGNSVKYDGDFGVNGGQRIFYSFYDEKILNNQPNQKPYYGRSGRNAYTRILIEVQNSTYLPSGKVYEEIYPKEYDQYGRTKREVQYGKKLNSSWPYHFNTNGIGVMYYEYACP